ncbi:hypothetical protein GQ600_10466 [Phytophthora cactorum]|nr:hypothetical protein GQ600_10466 [Phytophthora cactorum]
MVQKWRSWKVAKCFDKHSAKIRCGGESRAGCGLVGLRGAVMWFGELRSGPAHILGAAGEPGAKYSVRQGDMVQLKEIAEQSCSRITRKIGKLIMILIICNCNCSTAGSELPECVPVSWGGSVFAWGSGAGDEDV